MANKDGIISAPIDISSDVYPVLGLTPINGVYTVGYVCANDHGKVNMWSRMKPMHNPNIFTYPRPNEWWRGADQNCGFTLKQVNSYLDIPDAYTADGMNGWKYNPPKGGESSPYRLGDFNQYFHDAIPPVYGLSVPEKVATDGKLWVTTKIAKENEDNAALPGSLTLFDFKGVKATDDVNSLGDYYFGFVIKAESKDTRTLRVTSTFRGAGGIASFDLSTALLLQDVTYMVYPFLALNAISQSSADATNTYYTIPNVKPMGFKVVSASEAIGLTVFFTADKALDGTNIAWELKIAADKAVEVYDSYVQCRYQSSGSLANDEYQTNIGAFSIAANRTFTTSGSFKITSTDKAYVLYLYLRTNKGTFTRKVTPRANGSGAGDEPYIPWLPEETENQSL